MRQIVEPRKDRYSDNYVQKRGGAKYIAIYMKKKVYFNQTMDCGRLFYFVAAL